MKLHFPKTILLAALLFACPMLMVSEEPFTSEPKLSQSEAESLVKNLAAQEEELEQSCRRIAATYREMAAPSPSDTASMRELKRHYERLADNEERAAAAAKRMATYHVRLAVLISHSSDVTKTRNLLGDAAYRR